MLFALLSQSATSEAAVFQLAAPSMMHCPIVQKVSVTGQLGAPMMLYLRLLYLCLDFLTPIATASEFVALTVVGPENSVYGTIAVRRVGLKTCLWHKY